MLLNYIWNITFFSEIHFTLRLNKKTKKKIHFYTEELFSPKILQIKNDFKCEYDCPVDNYL